MMRRTLFLALAAVAARTGCEGYDVPDQAEPFDAIAPAPAEMTAVSGADEPGSQPEP